MNRNLITLIATCCLLTACGGVEPEPAGPADSSPEELTKPEARQRAAKADSDIDYCAILNWYGDGICDDFCMMPDPDCAPESDEPDDVYPPGDECDVDADCAAGQMCEQAFCPAYCAEVDGEDCCPDSCVPADPAPGDDEDECTVDADCGDGEVCGETICGAFCEEGAQCCPLACIPAPDPEPEGDECDADSDCAAGEACVELACPALCAEGADCCPDVCVAVDQCESDSDCGSGEVCQPGVCLHHCSVDDPTCCEPNECVAN